VYFQPSDCRLQDLLTEGMRETDQIRFNLDGIDPNQFRARAKNPIFDDGVTTRELHQVLSDPALRPGRPPAWLSF
jgi:hypothetical protein